jgi:hypothetical protein
MLAAGGNVTLRNVSMTANLAQGGAGGVGSLTRNGKQQVAKSGQGVGGGLYFDAAASAGLDAFTKSHVTLNTASTGKADIFGRYSTIS